jgi:hypothetical protein
VRHVRPADLHAAFAHAAAVMARFAAVLNQADAAKWRALAGEFAARTERLWLDNSLGRKTKDQRPKDEDDGSKQSLVSGPSSLVNARYADFDTRAGQLTDVDDVMLLAPLALGVAGADRAVVLRPAIAALDAARIEWPMAIWTAVEAARAAGMHDTAAELAWAIADRAYRFWDAREQHPDRTLPGVACEYWPVSGRCGGEGYGWGAFGLHLALHALLGFTPTEDALRLRPNLPAAWRVAGRRYTARLHCRGQALLVELAPLGPDRLRVIIGGRVDEIAWGEELLYCWDES